MAPQVETQVRPTQAERFREELWRWIASVDQVVVGAFALAGLLFVIATIKAPYFAGWANIRNLLVFASFLGFAALAEALVVLAGGIDLSVPWVMAFGGIQLAQFHAQGWPAIPSMVVVVLLGLVIGAINGVFATVLRVSPLIATLAVGGLVEAYLVKIGTLQSAGNTVPSEAVHLARGVVGPLPISALIWLGTAIVVSLVLTRTVLGRRMYAVGTNPRAARLSGIRVGRIRFFTYVISGGCCAFAGILLSGYILTAYLGDASDYLFGAVAAVALGGAALLGGQGSYWGAVAGCCTLTVLTGLLPVLGLSAGSLKIGYGIVILVGVYMARSLHKIRRRRRVQEELAQ
jgi:ribose transport system permease protein